MTELEQIFYQSEHSSDKWQPYFSVYERHLSKFRNDEINLVEVGVQKGGSLDMWGNYFTKAHITGIDIDEECANLVYKNPNIQVVIGNQEQPKFWDTFLVDREIDVFIDDGGHTMHGQTLTFEKVFPKIKLGGVYICEDTHTSYMPGYGGGFVGRRTFTKYARELVDVLHMDWANVKRPEWLNDLTSIHFYDSMVVFEKSGHPEMKNVFANE